MTMVRPRSGDVGSTMRGGRLTLNLSAPFSHRVRYPYGALSRFIEKRTRVDSGVELTLLTYASVGWGIIETTGAWVIPYNSSEYDRSVSSTSTAGGGPVIGPPTPPPLGGGWSRTSPMRRTGATVSPTRLAGVVAVLS